MDSTVGGKLSYKSIKINRDSKMPKLIYTIGYYIEEIVGDIYDEDDDGTIKKILSSIRI